MVIEWDVMVIQLDYTINYIMAALVILPNQPRGKRVIGFLGYYCFEVTINEVIVVPI